MVRYFFTLLFFTAAFILCGHSVLAADNEATLSFEEAVALALKQNLQLQSIQDRVTSATISLGAALADFKLKVHPEISGFYQQDETLDRSYGIRFTKQFRYGGELSWEAKTFVDDSLDEEYRTDLGVNYRQPLLKGRGTLPTTQTLLSAEQNVRTQQRALILGRQRLIVQVAASYYGIIRDRMMIAVNERSVERTQLLYRAAEAKLKVGMASKMDVFRAKLQTLTAENSLVDAHASLEHAKRRFNLLLGAEIETEYLFPSTLDYHPIALEPALLLQTAQEKRLEIQDARERIAESERQLKIATQNLLPPLDLSLSYTLRGEGNAFEKSLELDDGFWGIGMTSSFDLNLAQERAAFQQAKLSLNAAVRALKATQNTITSEVLQAITKVRQAEARVGLQKQSMVQAEKQLKLSGLRYKKGLSDNLDVVHAEENFVKAKNSYYSAIVQHLVASRQLQQATGTLTEAF
ncbi:hypothetical protein CSB45_06175 [candidate division KSB3 bacterium]|uniref:Transporter n=1 Tax=candidate division KSB3 bacterium TaxID=2044937 RepID=A0A2G6E6Y0_9BACT|nr:MAG: hypothetical protein CSB45_06175 [candidate division KSB3 bacterium]PIE30230.1 MAG: hypothetical protein CSA57_04885 [candidate division KSB3 bacterium]